VSGCFCFFLFSWVDALEVTERESGSFLGGLDGSPGPSEMYGNDADSRCLRFMLWYIAKIGKVSSELSVDMTAIKALLNRLAYSVPMSRLFVLPT